MAPHRGGNKSKYARSDNEMMEKDWMRAVKRDPLNTLYARAKSVFLARAQVKCRDFHNTLNAFAAATGDARFQAAAQAMEDHSLMVGNVKERIMAAALAHRCFKAEWAAMPGVHLWVTNGGGKVSVTHAAKMVAIEQGIPGTSFAEVVKDIRKTYPIWLKETFHISSQVG
jgi:hypothetical protein